MRANRTGDDAQDQRLVELLDAAGATADRDQLFEILASAVLLAGDGAHRLDLKITNAALKEMRAAFHMFAPYRDVPKVTIFGSARTRPEDPLYAQTHDLAAALAERGWMVVTGAGPGIMAAGMEGAGREHAIGVLIRLPFEGGANPFIVGDEKLIEMKYFFTRKLMLIKESAAFVALPGGFGTLDETFELLTLVQTGKAEPVPIVLLDTPGGSYWQAWQRFVEHEVAGNG
ncbi:MAG: TIGR00730 family Rossman fold protein, partial [Acidimicrobiales bacterium]